MIKSLYYIKTPLNNIKPIIAESLYHAKQKCVEQDGFLYSNNDYHEVKNKKGSVAQLDRA